MLNRFLELARSDEPVFITDVREAFLKEGTRPFHLHVHLYDDSVRRFEVRLPKCGKEEERIFISSYVHAMIYNILCTLGAVTIEVFIDPEDEESAGLAKELDIVFQRCLPKKERSGYGKCMNVNERVLSFLFKGKRTFSFALRDVKDEPEAAEETARYASEPVFTELPGKAQAKRLLGIDIGGTDIKLVVGINGTLAICKEYDWNPASFTLAEQLIDPVVLLVRLMRAGAALYAAGRENAIDKKAFSKDASAHEMEEGIRRMEETLGREPEDFDGIGLSFPDVIIDDQIVGGETSKTKGMRENTELDYEEQFAKISRLNEILEEYTTPDGRVMCTNDGPMAAFTAAVELAAIGADVSRGFFAHTLGTDLGTGWVRPDGSIPAIPLEVYNCIIDLGSFVQKQYPSSDVRSVNNFSTSLPGTLQKYTCQQGVFRLAAKYLPGAEQEVLDEALERGFFVNKSGELSVPTAPKDMRKPALEFFMEKAADGSSAVCRQIFKEIGTFLAVAWQETEYILRPETKARSLFGRLVREPACFDLICEGAKERVPSLPLYAADSSLANTKMMKQLDAHPDHTVAQFAQAVGALYFGCFHRAARSEILSGLSGCDRIIHQGSPDMEG